MYLPRNAVTRAAWFGYLRPCSFRQAYDQIAEKKSVTQRFDEKLKVIERDVAFRCGGVELSAQSLSNSSEYLVKALLENCELPLAMREIVLGLQGLKFDTNQVAEKEEWEKLFQLPQCFEASCSGWKRSGFIKKT